MTAIKRKEKKGLFYLIAIAIMVAIMGISCSESPTTPASGTDSGIGGGTDGGGAGIGGGTGTDGGYKVDVIYPEVAENLKSQGIDINNAKESDLDTIWKALANDRLLVNTDLDGVNSASEAKNKNHFSFDANGDMVSKVVGANNKIIKEFQKAVLVKVNGGYVIGGLYKVANLAGDDTIGKQQTPIIIDQKIGFNITAGDFEVVYINPNASYKNGKGYALLGNDKESTAGKTKDDFGVIVDNSILKQTLDGVNNPKSTYRSRFYRL